MTASRSALQAYNRARGAQPPLMLTVEVYDAALTQVARAKAARVANRRDEEFRFMTKATRILSELDGCLNRRDERAQDMSKMLSRYYKQTILQLHAALRTRGESAIDRYGSVHRQILIMRDAWARLAGLPPLMVSDIPKLPMVG
ncbi:flagellar protein FliS [Pararhodospirillum oryzae]|uniref:Flagellar protein FliS n=1 Tax=Pararhodospirillum oryzae TaxID=478448 RepID=A0A512H4N5_9PROT|nr:flagellar protein FliS [Pararhodospirillum oryzae]GEO80340.1 hypothetical protein ROR02_04710 [Pararhodospirillum oryzae]